MHTRLSLSSTIRTSQTWLRQPNEIGRTVPVTHPEETGRRWLAFLHADACLGRCHGERGGAADQGLGEQHRGTAVQDPERLPRPAVDRHPADQVVLADLGELDAEVADRRVGAQLVGQVQVGNAVQVSVLISASWCLCHGLHRPRLEGTDTAVELPHYRP